MKPLTTNHSGHKTSQTKEIYFAGGCFWGTEKYFKSIPGVVDVAVGYAQGHELEAPSYEQVCSGTTGCREAVRVRYNPDIISLDALTLAFFHIIDPTLKNQQGNDIGEQYQTGIYYTDAADAPAINKIMAIEKALHDPFAVEAELLTHFYLAEEYHQNYLEKNPLGYCHISSNEFNELQEVLLEARGRGASYDHALKDAFGPLEYRVTQMDETEAPYSNKYADETHRGLYVDITTGEPLFMSDDKYASSCGWPAFTKAIKDEVVIEHLDTSHGMRRTEVRSNKGDAHLGHVFSGDPESPTGTRYCINSASLRFIPLEHLDEHGYGDCSSLFK